MNDIEASRCEVKRVSRQGKARFALIISVICILLVFTLPVLALGQGYSDYSWGEADLSLIYPAGWDAPITGGDETALTLTLGAGDTGVTLVVMPASTTDGALRPALEDQLAAVNLLPLDYSADALYGRSGLRVTAASADRQQSGIGRVGRLPDSRALIVVARSPLAAQTGFANDLDAILNSLVFSASLPPVLPSYRTRWRGESSERVIISLAAGAEQLYALDAADGIYALSAQDGTDIGHYDFANPAQPTGIAVDGEGIVYVGDSVCRCVLRMQPDGTWLDPVGSFGGGAPFSLAVSADGTIYATDKTDTGYALRILGKPRNRMIGLNFNGSAPPLVTVGAGRVWVVEWLTSLIDGSVSAAISQVVGTADKPEVALQFWLESLAPENVRDAATDPNGDLVLATQDRGSLVINETGEIIDQFAEDGEPRALAFGADGTLYVARGEGAVAARSTHIAPDRWGNEVLALGVPVQGRLSEDAPEQAWIYAGTAGETVTLSAVDLSRANEYSIGLDMALRLTAPDGSEVEYNDDQLDIDLFGVYDAQIADVTLPQSGTYTINVEWRQGGGTYTLGMSGDQPISLSDDRVTRIEGRLQDAFPVQRWTFAGRQGDVLTLTMMTETGTLDPALSLLKPDGSLLAYNDDAYDPELEVNAQITQVALPADGLYSIEAARYEGAGRYSIVIVSTG